MKHRRRTMEPRTQLKQTMRLRNLLNEKNDPASPRPNEPFDAKDAVKRE